MLPRSNPDLEKIHDKATKWWIEVDDKGDPNREIGFDKDNNPIVIGPISNNWGMVTDSPLKFNPNGAKN